jgi:hypothetical protein
VRNETPLADSYLSSLTPAEARRFSVIDAAELEREKANVAPRVAARLDRPTRSVGSRLRAWEDLSVRMARNWQPSGYYLVDEYVNSLDIRDALEHICVSLEQDGQHMRELLGRIDGHFEELTVDDGGESILWYVRASPEELEGRNWWWRRAPHNPPWERPSAE